MFCLFRHLVLFSLNVQIAPMIMIMSNNKLVLFHRIKMLQVHAHESQKDTWQV